MMTMETTSALYNAQRMEYETPRGGITIGEYIARRLHKTQLLEPVRALIRQDTAQALAQIALYAIAGSTSFGPAMYQPEGNARGQLIDTTDPCTGARVRVICHGYTTFEYDVVLNGVGMLSGQEQIQGTTVGLRGLGMPAPSIFEFESADGKYSANLQGVITSELAPGLGRWRIRGYGELNLRDNAGNQGLLTLHRSGTVEIKITGPDARRIVRRERLVE